MTDSELHRAVEFWRAKYDEAETKLDSVTAEMKAAKARMWETGHENERLALRLGRARNLIANAMHEEYPGPLMAEALDALESAVEDRVPTDSELQAEVNRIARHMAGDVEDRGPHANTCASLMGIDCDCSLSFAQEAVVEIHGRCERCYVDANHQGPHRDVAGNEWPWSVGSASEEPLP